MKYRLPDGCTAVSRAGKPLTVSADGTVDLGPAAAADLLPHGIRTRRRGQVRGSERRQARR